MSLYLKMIIDRRSYLLPSSSIETILALSSVALELSETGDVGGAAMMNDRVIPLIDIRRAVYGKPSRFYLNTRILIPSALDDGSLQYGFIVEKVLDLVRIENMPNDKATPEASLISGVPCYFLNLSHLVDKYLGVMHGRD